MFLSDGWLLWILIPAYLVWLGAWFTSRAWQRRGPPRAHATVRFSSIATLKKLRPSFSLRLRRLVEGMRLVTVALLVLAMARPQTGRTQTKVITEGIDIVLVIDTSGSMQALDLDGHFSIARRRNRLEVVKSVIGDFVAKRDNDQIGMVVFGEDAFTQCPLTLDHGIVATFLERVEIGMAGDRTALGDALGTAVKRLKKSPRENGSKVIILLTDGRSNAGHLSPRKAAEVAKTFGIKVYTIGAGTRGKAPFLQDTLFGRQVVHQDVPIDEETLYAIAKITGGSYFRAEDGSALEKIYDRIDEMERTKIEMESYQEYNERFAVFALPALILLVLELLLLGTRFRKIP
ncbi:MAG: VWA domain-containing protein [Myxococcota bacterium]